MVAKLHPCVPSPCFTETSPLLKTLQKKKTTDSISRHQKTQAKHTPQLHIHQVILKPTSSFQHDPLSWVLEVLLGDLCQPNPSQKINVRDFVVGVQSFNLAIPCYFILFEMKMWENHGKCHSSLGDLLVVEFPT